MKPRPFKLDIHPVIKAFRDSVAEERSDDPVTSSLIARMRSRAAKGLDEYGTNLSDSGLSRVELLRHAQEEALDLAAYLEAEIQREEQEPK